MRNQVLAHHPAQCVLELHGLDEQIMLRVEAGSTHRRLEVKTKPFLNTAHAGALGQIEEKNEIENDGRGENGGAAEKIHLDLHGAAQPAKDVDAIPAVLVVTPAAVIVDAPSSVTFACAVP